MDAKEDFERWINHYVLRGELAIRPLLPFIIVPLENSEIAVLDDNGAHISGPRGDRHLTPDQMDDLAMHWLRRRLYGND